MNSKMPKRFRKWLVQDYEERVEELQKIVEACERRFADEKRSAKLKEADKELVKLTKQQLTLNRKELKRLLCD